MHIRSIEYVPINKLINEGSSIRSWFNELFLLGLSTTRTPYFISDWTCILSRQNKCYWGHRFVDHKMSYHNKAVTSSQKILRHRHTFTMNKLHEEASSRYFLLIESRYITSVNPLVLASVCAFKAWKMKQG